MSLWDFMIADIDDGDLDIAPDDDERDTFFCHNCQEDVPIVVYQDQPPPTHCPYCGNPFEADGP